MTLVERGGSARSFHVDSARAKDLAPIIKANVDRQTRVMTDEGNHYTKVGKSFAKHDSVDHGRGEYAYHDRKTDTVVSTNTVEGFYSIFKRGMKGIYQHCGEQHLHRYLSEFDFRYSNRIKLGVNDIGRADRALIGAIGKRLTYRQSDSA
jgi:transposase-like protein